MTKVRCQKQITGDLGESLARNYLEGDGYIVHETNWRHGHLEIDIIASKGDTLHIVEVKTQRKTTAGFPEDSVNRKKLKNLIVAADHYMSIDKRWKSLQFDIFSIVLGKTDHEFLIIEDVYL
jgi:putative endonuclease